MAHSDSKKKTRTRSKSRSQSRDGRKEKKRKRSPSSSDTGSSPNARKRKLASPKHKRHSPRGKKDGKKNRKKRSSSSSSETSSTTSSSSSSSSSSSDNSSSSDSASHKKKGRHKKVKKRNEKQRKKKSTKKKGKELKKKARLKEKVEAVQCQHVTDLPGPSLEQWQKESSIDTGPVLTDEQKSRIQAMKPMTKEEWDAKQSVIRRVVDPETGRTRLIKGDSEVLEEIVSQERHKDINKQATKGDGLTFQMRSGLL